jgi:heme oxygenase (biliverdin-IX-beta and delta-forming)
MTDAPAPPPAPEDFDAVGLAKTLLREIRAATLATLTETGAPFATLTALATDHEGAPILLMSRLAQHTRHLEHDPRLSLLLARGGGGDPLAHPRLTLAGSARRDANPRLRARYLSRNPKAALYADFADFSFWRVEVESAFLNGGFGRAAQLSAAELLTPLAEAARLLSAEEEILGRLNAHEGKALARLAGARGGAAKWRASGLDPEGLDLVSGDLCRRVAFGRPVGSPAALAEAFAELVKDVPAR